MSILKSKRFYVRATALNIPGIKNSNIAPSRTIGERLTRFVLTSTFLHRRNYKDERTSNMHKSAIDLSVSMARPVNDDLRYVTLMNSRLSWHTLMRNQYLIIFHRPYPSFYPLYSDSPLPFDALSTVRVLRCPSNRRLSRYRRRLMMRRRRA